MNKRTGVSHGMSEVQIMYRQPDAVETGIYSRTLSETEFIGSKNNSIISITVKFSDL